MALLLLVLFSIATAFTLTSSSYDSFVIADAGKISMSKDGNAYTIISDSTVKYYRKINQQYIYVSQIGSVCYSSSTAVDCSYSRQWLSSDGQHLFYVHHNATTTLQVVKIVN